jgi:hypothetical protein
VTGVALAAIKVGQLAQVAWVSLVAGVAVTAAFSCVVLASGRSTEARRAGRTASASLHAGLAVLAFAVFIAVVGYGVHVMLTKS